MAYRTCVISTPLSRDSVWRRSRNAYAASTLPNFSTTESFSPVTTLTTAIFFFMLHRNITGTECQAPVIMLNAIRVARLNLSAQSSTLLLLFNGMFFSEWRIVYCSIFSSRSIFTGFFFFRSIFLFHN